MKRLTLVFSVSLLFLGCYDPEPISDNQAYFVVLNFSKELKIKSFESRNVWVIPDASGNPERIKIMIGLGLSEKKNQEHELAFAIVKTFTLNELGLSVEEAANFELTGNNLQPLFAGNPKIMVGNPQDVTQASEDGIYFSYIFNSEPYVLLPTTLEFNKEVKSKFTHLVSQSSNHIYRGQMGFSLYFQGTNGDILRLKDGNMHITFDF